MNISIEKKIFAGFAFALVIFLIIGAVTYENTRKLIETRRAMLNTKEVLRSLTRVLSTVTDAETGHRGFVITGDEVFLEPWQGAAERIQEDLAQVAQLNSDAPALEGQLAALRVAVDFRFAQIANVITVRRTQGFAAARDLVATRVGKAKMDEIRGMIARLENEEAKILRAREEAAQKTNRQAVLAVLGGSLVQLAVLGLVFRLTVFDIRARREAERALRVSEEFKTRVLESSGDCIKVLSLDGLLLSMNSEGQRQHGIQNLAEVLGQPWLNFWGEAARVLGQQAIMEAKAGRSGRFEAAGLNLLGERKWWDVIINPILDADGQPEKLLAVSRDITVSRAAEERFRVIFESSTDPHLLLDAGVAVDGNAAVLEILGLPDKAALLALRPGQISPEFQPDGMRSLEKIVALYQAAQNDGQVRCEWQVLRPDGELLPIEVCLTPVEVEGRPLLLAVWHDLREYQRATTALRESEERFQSFMDHSPAIAFIKDQEGRYVYMNQLMEEEFGVSFAELQGQTDAVWLPEETARVVAGSDRAIIETGRPSRMVHEVPVAHGESSEWLILSFPIQTVQGYNLVGGVGIDITRQKRAERELKEREAQFRDLFDEAPVAYHELDVNGRITRVNKTELAMLGYTAEEMVGRKVSDFVVHENGHEHIPEEFSGALRLETNQRTFRRKDYRHVPVLMRHKMITGADGQVCGMRSTLQDISMLKRKEEELRDAEEKYRSIFENAIEGIFQTTKEGSYMSVNPALAQIYGYASADELMRSVTHIDRQLYVDPQRRQEFTRLIAEKGAVGDFESEIQRKDGSRLWISERARAVRDQDGKLLYYEGTVEDITARREAAAAIREARDTALKSVALKSEFLANMSHEIRTPMNGIIGMTGLLLDTELTGKQRDFTETISSSADSLLTIINDILDFSKIEAGMLNFEEIDFHLGNVVEGAVEVLAPRAASKKLELASLVYSDVPLALCGDPGRLRQVLTNLIGNAVKFTESGEVIVRAQLESETPEVAVIRFGITDTGIGIAPEAVNRLFQAFVQADGSTTRRYGGTGLGLAICKQLVQQMHGEIWVESQPGAGSTFFFTARFPKQATALGTVPHRADLQDRRVLVVDDSQTNRAILHHLFAAWGTQHQAAASGAEALKLMRIEARRGRPFELVLLDRQMPGMDGLELARAIKAEPQLGVARLVMLTSLDRSEDSEELRALGVDAYLTKPVKQNPLYECLNLVLSTDLATRELKAGFVALNPARTSENPVAVPALRILIAEDNAVNQKVALHQLQKLGYHAAVVDSGEAALEALATTRYDLVFMDCQMPRLDGYAATREVRRRERGERQTWVVAMTANSLEGDREKCLAAGMDDYVSKPVKTENLRAAIDRFHGLRTIEREARELGAPLAIDLEALAGFRDLENPAGDDLLAKLIDVFLENSPKLIAEARTALAGNLSPLLVRAAHTLKGSCSNFGAERLGEACQQLEDLAGGPSLEGGEKLLAVVEKEFAYVRVALERERPAPALA